jgi:hypothetical protein
MKTYLIAFLILSLGMTTHQLNKQPTEGSVEEALRHEVEHAKIEHQRNQVVLQESQKLTKTKIEKTKEQLEAEKIKANSILKKMTLFQQIIKVEHNREEDSLYQLFLMERKQKEAQLDSSWIND